MCGECQVSRIHIVRKEALNDVAPETPLLRLKTGFARDDNVGMRMAQKRNSPRTLTSLRAARCTVWD